MSLCKGGSTVVCGMPGAVLHKSRRWAALLAGAGRAQQGVVVSRDAVARWVVVRLQRGAGVGDGVEARGGSAAVQRCSADSQHMRRGLLFTADRRARDDEVWCSRPSSGRPSHFGGHPGARVVACAHPCGIRQLVWGARTVIAAATAPRPAPRRPFAS